MRSGEEHLKRRKARYLKRREDGASAEFYLLKKSNVVGSRQSVLPKYAKLSFSGGNEQGERT